MTTIVPLTVWGSTFDYTKRSVEKPADPKKIETCLHHSDTVAPDESSPLDDEYAAMRLLEKIGTERFGSGLSYNVAVMPSGRAYQGQPLGNKATHSAFEDWNYTRASIVLVGNYHDSMPTESMLRKVAAIQAHWMEQRTISKINLRWHSQVQATDCPGDFALSQVTNINQWAAALEDDMALFESKTEFRAEVRRAVEAELNEQWPTRTSETVNATVAVLQPLLPPGIDTAALVAEIVAKVDTPTLVQEIVEKVNRPLTVVREESYRIVES